MEQAVCGVCLGSVNRSLVGLSNDNRGIGGDGCNDVGLIAGCEVVFEGMNSSESARTVVTRLVGHAESQTPTSLRYDMGC